MALMAFQEPQVNREPPGVTAATEVLVKMGHKGKTALWGQEVSQDTLDRKGLKVRQDLMENQASRESWAREGHQVHQGRMVCQDNMAHQAYLDTEGDRERMAREGHRQRFQGHLAREAPEDFQAQGKESMVCAESAGILGNLAQLAFEDYLENTAFLGLLDRVER